MPEYDLFVDEEIKEMIDDFEQAEYECWIQHMEQVYGEKEYDNV